MSNLNHRPDVLDDATGALRDTPIPDGPPAELLAAAVAAIDHRLAGAVPAGPSRRKRIMRYVGYTTATATAVVIATLAGILWLGGNSAAARVQKALDNAAKAKSVRLVWTREFEGKTTLLMTVHIQDGRSRWEGRNRDQDTTLLIDIPGRQGLNLNHIDKTAKREALTGDRLTDARTQHEVFFNPLGVLRDTKDMTVKELDGEKIDGRPMKVFMLSHPGNDEQGAMTAVLWIDQKTDLPARLKLLDDALATEDPSGPKVDTVIAFEDWNKEFDAKLFRLDVPEGYKEVEGPKDPAESVVYNMTDTRKDQPADTRTTTHYAQGGASRVEYPTGTIIAVNGRRLVFDPHAKIYRIDTYSPEQPRNLPQEFLDALLEVKDNTAKALGEEKIGGVAAKKYEVAVGKPGASGPDIYTLWLDPDTGYPVKVHVVRWKSDFTNTYDKFRWNEKLDPKLFSLDPPEGYTPAGKQEIPISPAKD